LPYPPNDASTSLPLAAINIGSIGLRLQMWQLTGRRYRCLVNIKQAFFARWTRYGPLQPAINP
jgi:hypothetical protein